MQKFIEALEHKMVPIAFKPDSNQYITAIKGGFLE